MGNLAFADEVLTIILCPLWGVLSDKIGTRPVATIGLFLVGINLFVYTTVKTVYPGLLLMRLFFAVGASASASMITAILSEISTFRVQPGNLVKNVAQQVINKIRNRRKSVSDFSAAREQDISVLVSSLDVESRYHDELVDQFVDQTEIFQTSENNNNTSRKPTQNLGPEIDFPLPSLNDGANAEVGGSQFLKATEPGSRNGTGAALVGLCSGLGACFAVFVLLSLPLALDKTHDNPAKALKKTYYIVGGIALFVAGILFLGLHRDRTKSFKYWISQNVSEFDRAALDISIEQVEHSYFTLLKNGFIIALNEPNIALAYVGGFVARSTTVATVMFIPLIINVYFHREGNCVGNIHDPQSELKYSCPKAYLISVIVTGISQTASLVFAPVWGVFVNQFGRKMTLLVSGVIGFIGFLGFGFLEKPVDSANVYIYGGLMGVAQIGTIISSMSLCTDRKRDASGAIAGVYSLCGGIGILLLSKLGGWLSDKWPGAPFLILASFYMCLILLTLSQMTDNISSLLEFFHLKSQRSVQI